MKANQLKRTATYGRAGERLATAAAINPLASNTFISAITILALITIVIINIAKSG